MLLAYLGFSHGLGDGDRLAHGQRGILEIIFNIRGIQKSSKQLTMSVLVMRKFFSVGVVSLIVAVPCMNATPRSMALDHQPPETQPVVYDFTIDVTAGSLAGMSYDGHFCYDAAAITGTGTETLGVDDGLKSSILFFGQIYTQVDDSNYPEFPQLTLTEGEIEQLDFWIEAGDRLVWWDLPGWEVTLTPTAAGTPCPIDVADSEAADSEAADSEAAESNPTGSDATEPISR
ncbi:MAG: hypothetical protein AB4042_10595 [Leptolyngbyaceae cyanobacterium]